MDLHVRHITDMEAGLSDYSDRIVVLESNYVMLKMEYNVLVDKVDDLENRSQRSNLRVVGIPEKMEGSDPAKFMTELFRDSRAQVLPHGVTFFESQVGSFSEQQKR